MNYISKDVLYLSTGECIFDNDMCIYSITSRSITKDRLKYNKNIRKVNINLLNQVKINSYKYVIFYKDGNLVEYRNDIILSIDDIKNKGIIKIGLNNLSPKFTHLELLFNGCNYCEIGVRYGASIDAILKHLSYNNISSSLYLFEINESYNNLLKHKYSDMKNVHIYEGDAENTLKEYDGPNFDVVFFDCSHKYDIDKKILEELVKHLSTNSYIIFDDYKLKDVKKLVDEFVDKYNNFNVIK